MLNNLFKKLLGGENQTRNQVLNRPQSQVPYAPQQGQQQPIAPQIAKQNQNAIPKENYFRPVRTGYDGGYEYPSDIGSPRSIGPNFGLQQPGQTYWQNTDGVRRNMMNPQLSDFDDIELQDQGLRNYFNF